MSVLAVEQLQPWKQLKGESYVFAITLFLKNFNVIAMRLLKLLSLLCLVVCVLPACHKERSNEDSKIQPTDTLPFNYPFATGYCKDGGASLGISIIDTATFVAADSAALPTSLLLTMPVPGNQGSKGCCSAWATVYAAGTYYAHAMYGKEFGDTGNLNPDFTYNQIAKGNCTCTSILDNLYLLKTQGACSLAAMPYNDRECITQPDSMQRSNAASYKIKGWQRVDLHNVALLKRAIAEKKPVIFAIRVDDGFKELASPYLWKERSGALGEGHAMVITGFDDSKNAFRIMNSWSSAWGDGGFAWISYDFFLENVIDGGYIII